MSKLSRRSARPLTARGEKTRLRIVEAAAVLIHARGAAQVSIDEVMEASGTSKSQIYHYFADKEGLVQAVITLQTRRIVQANGAHLDDLDSFEALRKWRDALIDANRTGGINGCPIGSLANELGSQSESARALLAGSFEAWSTVIANALSRMQAQGQIEASADPHAIAVAVLAAIQGGVLMSKSARSSTPLELAFDMALSHIERHAA